MTAPRFAGEPVLLGDTEYTVPPLGLFAVKTLLPTIQRIAISPSGGVANLWGQLDDVLDLCHAALLRNYPDLTREALVELIDLTNFATLVDAVVRQSGLTAVQEKNAQAVASLSRGQSSTAASSPPLDGAGSTSTST